MSGNKLTVEALITRIPGGSTLNIVSKHTDPGNVNYLLRPTVFEITTSDGFFFVSNPISPLPINTVFHVAATYDGAELRYYVNGCLVNTAPCTGTMVLNNLNTAAGNQSTNQNEPFTGYIDELRIWNVVRTQAEIQANMNTLPNPTTQPGLIAYYNFDAGFNNIQGNSTWNGTAVGAAVIAANPNSTGLINNLSVTGTTMDNACFNGNSGTLTATASGAFPPYTFSLDGSSYQSSANFSGLSAGTYIVYAKTNATCIDTATLIIGEPSKISITTVQAFAPCDSFATATAAASGGTGPTYTYQWNSNPVQATATATGLAAGTYTILATDVNSCTDSAFFTAIITAPLALTFNLIDPPCPGECNGTASAIGSGGNSPYSYLWSNGQLAQTATALCADTFFVSVTDGNGCVFNDTTIQLQALPIVSTISSSNSNCGQPDGTATVSNISGGGNPGTYSFLWDSAAANQTTATATGLTNGVYSIAITSGFCDTTVTATVGFNPPPTASATGDSSTCFGECNGTGIITALGGPAPGTFFYLWDNGETTQTATGLCPGNHLATATDSTGCSASASVFIDQPDLLIASIAGDGDTSICTSGTVTISANAIGGTAPYNFLWSNGWGTAGPNSENPVSTACYEVTVTDMNGCDTASSLYCASIYPPIQASSLNKDTICEGNSLLIGATAAGGHPDSTITFLWNTGETTDSITVTPSTYPFPQNYTVVASDGCSPNDTAVVTINHFITPLVSFTSDTTSGCMPLTINFENTTPNTISYQWNFGNGNSSTMPNPLAIFEDTGNYNISLAVISSDTCPGDTTYLKYIRVNPLPPANAGKDTTVYQESTIQLTASGGLNYVWDSGENTATIKVTPPQTTTYNVTVTDAAGCESFGEVKVTVDFKYVIFVPSMFSPNNDGNNDMLYVRGLGIDYFTLQIFDRWGEKIFETSDLSNGWDGKFRGKEMNEGVFVFTLQAGMDNGEVVKRQGNITLVK